LFFIVPINFNYLLTQHNFCSQLAKETWFCLLAFMPRHQLGQIILQIGDRQFAGIAQSFLHDEVDNKVTLGNIWISLPRDLDAIGHPSLKVWPKYCWYAKPWRTISQQLVLPSADVPMPKNIKDFVSLRIRFAYIPKHYKKSKEIINIRKSFFR
jgi:hypothetical protein